MNYTLDLHHIDFISLADCPVWKCKKKKCAHKRVSNSHENVKYSLNTYLYISDFG